MVARRSDAGRDIFTRHENITHRPAPPRQPPDVPRPWRDEPPGPKPAFWVGLINGIVISAALIGLAWVILW